MLDFAKNTKLRDWGFNEDQLPPIGASPDGILSRSEGEREIIEIKNICPFEWEFTIRKYCLKYKEPWQEIPPNYIPQVLDPYMMLLYIDHQYGHRFNWKCSSLAWNTILLLLVQSTRESISLECKGTMII
jgi:hypothetical protein